MRVLVTGATGFTGKALVKRLIDDGHEVIALDYKEGYKTGEIRDWGARLVMGSVTDRALVESCMRGVDVVQHIAAAFREYNLPESRYDEVNIEGTRITLQAALEAGVRKFVYCSTCGVHGNVDDPPADEESPIQPADYYQRSKYLAEPIVQEFVQKGLKATILRPAAIYGPGDPGRFFMIFKRIASGSFPMFGDGKVYYHPLFVDNLVDALVLAMDEGRGNGRAYLIADEEYLEIEDMVRRVARAMGVDVRIPHYPLWPLIIAGHVVEKVCRPLGIEPPIFPRRVDWYRQHRAFSIERARRELGYDPKVGIDEGFRRAYEWYKAEGMLA